MRPRRWAWQGGCGRARGAGGLEPGRAAAGGPEAGAAAGGRGAGVGAAAAGGRTNFPATGNVEWPTEEALDPRGATTGLSPERSWGSRPSTRAPGGPARAVAARAPGSCCGQS